MTISNTPIYVTTRWPGPSGPRESRSEVKPGGTLTTDGPATVAIPKTYAEDRSEITWSASLSHDGAAPTPLRELPGASVAPTRFHKATGAFMPQFRVGCQAFQLPFVPGDSHLTMVAKSVAGKIIATEQFNVQGTMA